MPNNAARDRLIRPITITRSFLKYPEGSALIEFGDTKVICTASVEEKVPSFLKGMEQGWITAEYAMLPRSTEVRTGRERTSANSRSLEIQRLIGRSLRAVIDLNALGERTIRLDCDVIQADGSTRTASISGAFVALAEALIYLKKMGQLVTLPLYDYLSAVSVGLVDSTPVIDLSYKEDSRAAVDMNIVMTAAGKLVEVQGSAEDKPFSRETLNELLDLASAGIAEITREQKKALGKEIVSLIDDSIARYGKKDEHGG